MLIRLNKSAEKLIIESLDESYLKSGRAPYYHSIDLNSLSKVLKSNTLGGKFKKSSTYVSRDKNYLKNASKEGHGLPMNLLRHHPDIATIELNGDKLHQTHKIVPGMRSREKAGDVEKTKSARYEAESRIMGQVKNLDHYIDAIHIGQKAHRRLKKGKVELDTWSPEEGKEAYDRILKHPKLKIQKDQVED